MKSHLLTKDAYFDILKRKDEKELKASIKRDYKGMYGEEPSYNYVSPFVKSSDKKEGDKKAELKKIELTKEQTKENEKFKQQFTQLLNQYKNFATTHKLTHLHSTIDSLNSKYFLEQYSGEQSNESFKNIKLNLEEHFFLIADNSFDLEIRLNSFKKVCESFGVCASGVYGRVDDGFFDLLLALASKNDIFVWLAQLRTNIIRTLAAQHCQRYNISEGSSIHVHNGYMNYSIAEDVAPISKVGESFDPFAQTLTGIDEVAISQFNKRFKEEYSPVSIINWLSGKISEEYQKQIKDFEGEAKDGWRNPSKEFFEALDKMFKQIDLSEFPLTFFEASEDCSQIKFNDRLLKGTLTNYLHDKKLLLNPVFFHEVRFSEEYKWKIFHFEDRVKFFLYSTVILDPLNNPVLITNIEPYIAGDMLGGLLSVSTEEMDKAALQEIVKGALGAPVEDILRCSESIGAFVRRFLVTDKSIRLIRYIEQFRDHFKQIIQNDPTKIINILLKLESENKPGMEILQFLMKEKIIEDIKLVIALAIVELRLNPSCIRSLVDLTKLGELSKFTLQQVYTKAIKMTEPMQFNWITERLLAEAVDVTKLHMESLAAHIEKKDMKMIKWLVEILPNEILIKTAKQRWNLSEEDLLEPFSEEHPDVIKYNFLQCVKNPERYRTQVLNKFQDCAIGDNHALQIALQMSSVPAPKIGFFEYKQAEIKLSPVDSHTKRPENKRSDNRLSQPFKVQGIVFAKSLRMELQQFVKESKFSIFEKTPNKIIEHVLRNLKSASLQEILLFLKERIDCFKDVPAFKKLKTIVDRYDFLHQNASSPTLASQRKFYV